jgi:phospholipase/carboxylesterase
MRETNQSRAGSFVKAKLGPPIALDCRHAALLKCDAMRDLKLGTLTAHVTGGTDREGGGTGPVVVLLHGYGAPGTDLVPLWRELALPHEVRFVFPEAPVDLGFGGRAWWPLDMARLQDRFSKSAAERLIAEVPPGIDAARGALLELLSVLERDFGALPEQTVIGGFSQGAMLATDTVLRSTRPFGALAILSGSLISHDEWLPLMGARRGLPVLQSHGRTDPVLPFELAERLCSELVAAGLPVEFVAFNGGHGIPGGVLEGLTRLVRRLTPEPA